MSAASCQLCPNGASPLYPDVTITFTDGSVTCSDLQNIFPLIDDELNCVALQLVASDTCCETSWNDVCDPSSDPCPLAGDGLCKSISDTMDPNMYCLQSVSDCYDCDPCHLYAYTSCDNCTSHPKCYWCPADALCLSRPYSSYPDPILGQKIGSCPSDSDWSTSCSASTSTSEYPFSDPLYEADLWAYDMINVRPAWNLGLTGAGVHVRINDDGVDADHPEFEDRFDAAASCQVYLPSDDASAHGTASASIAAGAGNNDWCGVGIAPKVTLSACNIFEPTVQLYVSSWQYLTLAMDAQHVSSNSYAKASCVLDASRLQQRSLQASCPFNATAARSPCDACDDLAADPLATSCTRAIILYCANPVNYESDPACTDFLELFATCRYNGISPQLQEQFTIGVTQGRNGLGIVYVFAAGNDQAVGTDTNYDGFFTSRFVISVAAVGKDGVHSMYSTPGASVFVSGPGGDFEFESNWITAKAQGGCTSIGVGTSFAAPAVSGVVALMLEANPNLGWRDVQGIFANTSQILDAIADDDTWVTNAAGFSHSNKYGFGVVDAAAAVAAASAWENFGTERMLSAYSGDVGIPIDDATSSTITSTVSIKGIMTIESVVVYLDLESSSRGYLEIRLASPSGTESILTPGFSPENTQLPDNVRMKLMTLKNWGESSGGEWTLSITVTKPGQDVSACVDLPLLDDASLTSDSSCFQLQQNLHVYNLTIDEACAKSAEFSTNCCLCGGGEDASNIQDQLNSWTLVLYGRDLIGNLAPTVSPAPTFSNGDSQSTPVASPTDGSGPTTLTPTIVAFRKPTNSPSVQSATSPSSASTGCFSELDAVRGCLAAELSLDPTEECASCLQDEIASVVSDDVTTCSPLEDVLCSAFAGPCDCGSCADLYLQYMSCASANYVLGGCQFDCGNATTTDGGGNSSGGNGTATDDTPPPSSASPTPFSAVLPAVVVLQVVAQILISYG